MTRLLFPGVAEDMSDAFNSAIEAGTMERDTQSRTFWARFEFLASDIDDDEVIQADWFHNTISDVFICVPRKDIST